MRINVEKTKEPSLKRLYVDKTEIGRYVDSGFKDSKKIMFDITYEYGQYTNRLVFKTMYDLLKNKKTIYKLFKTVYKLQQTNNVKYIDKYVKLIDKVVCYEYKI